MAVRAALGLAQGVLFPCLNPMLVRWSPQNEQNKFSALASMGGTFGTIFIYPAVGILLEASGWKAVFYLGGAVSFAWCGFMTVAIVICYSTAELYRDFES